jgi:hypothetical protein
MCEYGRKSMDIGKKKKYGLPKADRATKTLP